jgi:hypothetical protein
MPIAIDSPQRLKANFPFAMRACLVAILTGLVGIGCGDGPTGPNGASVRVVQGGGGTDTILALPPTPLVVEVRSSLGRPLSGVSVRFVVEPMSLADSGPRRRVYVCSLTQSVCASFSDCCYDVTYGVQDTTDDAGRVRVRVQFGAVAGPARIQVSLPDLGGTTVAQFTTRPGSLSQVAAAVQDTAIYVATEYDIGAYAADRLGNARQEPVTLTSSTPAVINVAGGRVTGVGLGRGRILMQSGPITDTAFVSVPPTGRLVTFGWAPDFSSLTQLTLVNTDGSGRRLLRSTRANNGSAWPVWTPNGGAIVYQEAGPVGRGQLELIDTLGDHRVLLPDSAGLTFSVQPAFSGTEAALYFFGFQESSGLNGIYRANPDGTGSQLLFAATQPAPSPNGSHLAYAINDSLFVRDMTTGLVSPLAPSPQLPRWSPVGDLIAYVSNDGAAVVRVVRSDGNDLRTLVPGFHDQAVSWSPDGQWLAVARYAGGIELIRVADGERLHIAGTETLFQPAWRP